MPVSLKPIHQFLFIFVPLGYKKNMVKVYTKQGDKGTTSLYNGTRLPKNSFYFEALGAIDELSSHLGHLVVLLSSHDQLRLFNSSLKTVQTRLMDMGSSIATPDGRNYKKTRFERQEDEVERWIDFLDTMLPRLTNFILPGGSEPAAVAHVCRSVCRRAERNVLSVVNVDESISIYLNRLSDYFFTLARYINLVLDQPDIIYCASNPEVSFIPKSTNNSDEKVEPAGIAPAVQSTALKFCSQDTSTTSSCSLVLNDAAVGSER
jgi:cob(I)alamin adenosyltransferase